jgi:hypothetical protein
VAFASFDVDFVPPSQTNQTASSDVLKVVEIDSEEDERKDEDKDAEKGGQLLSSGWSGRNAQIPDEKDAEEVHEQATCN